MWHQDHYSCQQCHLRFNPFPSALSNAHPQPTRPGGAARHPTRSIPGGKLLPQAPPHPQFSPGVLFPILGNCQANTANNNSTRDRKILLNSRYLVSSLKKKKMGWGGEKPPFFTNPTDATCFAKASPSLSPPRRPASQHFPPLRTQTNQNDLT